MIGDFGLWVFSCKTASETSDCGHVQFDGDKFPEDLLLVGFLNNKGKSLEMVSLIFAIRKLT